MEKLDEIRTRTEQATSGVWHMDDAWGDIRGYSYTEHIVDEDKRVIVTLNGPAETRRNNAEFIAHARQDIPYLLDELQSAHRRIEALEAQLAAYAPHQRKYRSSELLANWKKEHPNYLETLSRVMAEALEQPPAPPTGVAVKKPTVRPKPTDTPWQMSKPGDTDAERSATE